MKLLWVWVAATPLVWFFTRNHPLPFDPMRAWLMVGWIGRLIASRWEPATETMPEVPLLSNRWIAIHCLILLLILRTDVWLFDTIARDGLFFMPHPLARIFFALGDGLTQVGLLLVLR